MKSDVNSPYYKVKDNFNFKFVINFKKNNCKNSNNFRLQSRIKLKQKKFKNKKEKKSNIIKSINNKISKVSKLKMNLSSKSNLTLSTSSMGNLISESLSVTTATSTATLLPQYCHELASSFSLKNKNKSKKILKISCFEKTFTSKIKNNLQENDENYLRNNCNSQFISNSKDSKTLRPQLEKMFLRKHEINCQQKKINLKKLDDFSEKNSKENLSDVSFFLNTNFSKLKNNKFLEKNLSLNTLNKSSSLLSNNNNNNNKQITYSDNTNIHDSIYSTSKVISSELHLISNSESVDYNNIFIHSKIVKLSKNLNLFKVKWKQLKKGFNSKKKKINQHLNINSKNFIERLLLHKQCKNSNSDEKLNEKFNDKSKITSNKNNQDKKKHNISETMKSVDYRDLNLLQILALKSICFNALLTLITCQNDYVLVHNKKVDKKFISNYKINLILSVQNNDQIEKSTIVVSKNLNNNNSNNMEKNFTSNFFVTNNDLKKLKNLDDKITNVNFNEAIDANQLKKSILNKNRSFNLNLSEDQKCNFSKTSNNVKMNSSDSNWFQLAGHQNSFTPSKKPGKIWKKTEYSEYLVYKCLNESNDSIIEFLPKFYSIIKTNEGQFIEIQDLLSLFNNPSLMDIKMGCRTFLENDVLNSCPRLDLYEKLIKIDPGAATQDENKNKAITKLRYMTFRDNLSSSSTLCFRIEAFKCKYTEVLGELKYLRKVDDVKKLLKIFLLSRKDLKNQLLTKLIKLKSTFKKSHFFKNHEIIGSSLLIIYDDNNLGVWMIDFAKTVKLPSGIKINHKSSWSLGNHEDGYLTGLNNLISIIKEIS